MSEVSPPSLYEWMGGKNALDAMLIRFYERVAEDALLAPVFAHMSKEHAAHVSAFIAEVFGGPKQYSESLGGHPNMIRHHLGRALDERKRKRWVDLLCDCANELGVPDDPEFRSAFVAYLEWGSRLAVINSQPGSEVDPDQPMPSWGWGEVKRPYRAP